ncbi:formimidoylglutamate deiminase [Sphingomonas sp.]|uniref:formimidoylglutamate deiminase n=1 Tax=Sphingomonas sp. TaxID=28214 RepID=UPI001B2C6DA1|nr:formimidoylglutamate deiminase [Sphingomonas sp.]MBO9713445.1 formimidoylglutamate deiminase [Sphingomonas sp.]
MPLWFESALLDTGWADAVRVTIADGRIASLETGAAIGPGDARHGPALAGLPNLHSHAFQRAMAGLTEVRGPSADSFWTWREAMYRFVDRLDPDGLRDVAALAYAEMLEGGFTRVGEFHYLHHAPDGAPYEAPAATAQAIAEAANETGIAVTLLPVFYNHADFGGVPATSGQRRFVNGLDAYARLWDASAAAIAGLPRANIGVAPHSLRAVTPEELEAVVALARGGPIHIHAAEQLAEVESCLAWSGARPVEWLLDHGAGPGWCLVHATHMTPEETLSLARSGAVAGLCPITEANLGDGIFPADDYLPAGGLIGIGSDSNVLIDAAQELRMLEYSQRLAKRARNVLAAGEGASTGASLYAAALRGGGAALGVPATPLAQGAPADIVAFAPGQPHKGDTLLDAWVFASRSGMVDSVWVHGQQQVADGRHRLRDAIEPRYRALLAELLE